MKSGQHIAIESVGGLTTDRNGGSAEALPHVARKGEIVTGMTTAASAEIEILIGGATEQMRIDHTVQADDMMIEIDEIATAAILGLLIVIVTVTEITGMSVVGLPTATVIDRVVAEPERAEAMRVALDAFRRNSVEDAPAAEIPMDARNLLHALGYVSEEETSDPAKDEPPQPDFPRGPGSR